MTEPVLLFAFEEAEINHLIAPVTDEDMARGYLEQGWAPTHLSKFKNLATEDAQTTGSLCFCEITWLLQRTAAGEWYAPTRAGLFAKRMMKIRLPIDEDEELVLEPGGDDVVYQVGTLVMVRDVRNHESGIHSSSLIDVCTGYNSGSFLAVCSEINEDGPRMQLLGGMPGMRGTFTPGAPGFTTYNVCKRSAAPFVLK